MAIREWHQDLFEPKLAAPATCFLLNNLFCSLDSIHFSSWKAHPTALLSFFIFSLVPVLAESLHYSHEPIHRTAGIIQGAKNRKSKKKTPWKPYKMWKLLLRCLSDYTAVERMYLDAGSCYKCKEKQHSWQKQVTNPEFPGMVFFSSILFCFCF